MNQTMPPRVQQDTWMNQTQLGVHFGMSAVAIGKKLAELGLRGEDRMPTERAKQAGYCRAVPLKDGSPFYVWHRQEITSIFRLAGLEPLSPEESEAYAAARSLLAAARDADRSGIDRIFCIMVDEIPTERYEQVNRQLEHMGSALRLWQ